MQVPSLWGKYVRMTAPPKRTRNQLPWLVGSLIGLIWIASGYLCLSAYETSKSRGTLPNFGDLATVLFGSTSVALIILSIVIGLLAVFGWRDLQNTIHNRVESGIREKLEDLEHEMRGRIFSGLGYMIGELSTRPDSLKPDKGRESHLSHCIELCLGGYKELKRVGGPAELTGLNNLVYYSCFVEDETQRELQLERARILKRYSDEQYYFPRFLLTYCRVILQMGGDPEEKRQALLIAAKLAEAPIPKHEQNEARVYLTSFPPATAKP